MKDKTVLLEKTGKIGTITLNRPEKLNAMNDAMLRDLQAAFEEVKRDSNIWLVILKGAGQAFSVGEDLSGVETKEVVPPDPRTKPYLADLFEAGADGHTYWRAIFDFPRFIIAQVHGYCLGAACQLAMCCHTIISSEDAVFGDPSIRMGLAPSNPLWTWKVGLKKSKELLLTGKYIDSKEAERIGLVMKAVPSEKLEDEVKLLAETQLVAGTIGGYDAQVSGRINHHIIEDMAGLSAAWRYTSYLRSLSAIQRPGRSITEREEFNFYKVRDEHGIKAAITARDAPFEKYFPKPKAN